MNKSTRWLSLAILAGVVILAGRTTAQDRRPSEADLPRPSPSSGDLPPEVRSPFEVDTPAPRRARDQERVARPRPDEPRTSDEGGSVEPPSTEPAPDPRRTPTLRRARPEDGDPMGLPHVSPRRPPGDRSPLVDRLTRAIQERGELEAQLARKRAEIEILRAMIQSR